jgi:hypothetical protein
VRRVPDAADEYRGSVHQLRDARELLTDAEYTEARALVFEMLGGRVTVRPRTDGSAALLLNLDASSIVKACESMRYNLGTGAGFVAYFRIRVNDYPSGLALREDSPDPGSQHSHQHLERSQRAVRVRFYIRFRFVRWSRPVASTPC